MYTAYYCIIIIHKLNMCIYTIVYTQLSFCVMDMFLNLKDKPYFFRAKSPKQGHLGNAKSTHDGQNDA